MLFWHAGGTIALARYAFRDDRMDLRMLVLGAILPDLIDTPVALLFYGRLGSVRLVGHGLIVAATIMVVVVLLTRRGRPRKKWMPLAIGILLHILLDALWLDPETLWWPLFGWGFSPAGPETVSLYLEALARNWWMWLGELIGLLYMGYLWIAAGLRDPGKRSVFVQTGRIDLPIEGDVTC